MSAYPQSSIRSLLFLLFPATHRVCQGTSGTSGALGQPNRGSRGTKRLLCVFPKHSRTNLGYRTNQVGRTLTRIGTASARGVDQPRGVFYILSFFCRSPCFTPLLGIGRGKRLVRRCKPSGGNKGAGFQRTNLGKAGWPKLLDCVSGFHKLFFQCQTRIATDFGSFYRTTSLDCVWEKASYVLGETHGEGTSSSVLGVLKQGEYV